MYTGCYTWLLNSAVYTGCYTWLPISAVHTGCYTWLPNSAVYIGCYIWLPNSAVYTGCYTWLPNSAVYTGCYIWLLNSDYLSEGFESAYWRASEARQISAFEFLTRLVKSGLVLIGGVTTRSHKFYFTTTQLLNSKMLELLSIWPSCLFRTF